jgi:hypothetical protein
MFGANGRLLPKIIPSYFCLDFGRAAQTMNHPARNQTNQTMTSTRNNNSAPPPMVVTPKDDARSEGLVPRAQKMAKLEAWKTC